MKRSEAFFILDEMYEGATGAQRKALDMAKSDLEFVDLMPYELAPVVHGEWVLVEYQSSQFGVDQEYQCSICGTPTDEEFRTRYCPNCGAKMDGERKGDDGTN